ncbi:MAG: metalloregulator ArsR/SmtB family transcription factor [Chloroflexota bacterium]
MDQSLRAEINRLHAQVCAGLADPTRIMMLYTLAEKPRHVNELADILELSQPTTSRHLKVLRDRHLVTASREGRSVVYSLTDERVIRALDLLREVMAEILKVQSRLAETASSELPT